MNDRGRLFFLKSFVLKWNLNTSKKVNSPAQTSVRSECFKAGKLLKLSSPFIVTTSCLEFCIMLTPLESSSLEIQRRDSELRLPGSQPWFCCECGHIIETFVPHFPQIRIKSFSCTGCSGLPCNPSAIGGQGRRIAWIHKF